MASGSTSQAQAGQTKRTSFGGFPGANASMFLDRSKAGMRGSTPDSEALASSDDEQDHHHRLQPVTSNPGPKPTRRPSWLNEAQQASIRKGSFGGNGPFSPASLSSTVPPGEQIPWGSAAGSATGSGIGRGHSTSTSFPWGSTIWNNDSQKGPPQRLTEVLPSPTSMVPPASAGLFSEEPLRSPLGGQETLAESSIPFAIPLQPTLKTYRSQSYSVGQLDQESSSLTQNNYAGYGAYVRSRSGVPYTGLQHRPSRPSMLGDSSHDPLLLEQLQEVDDDEESSNESDSGIGIQHTTKQARTIEQLEMENARLRQAAAEQLKREADENCGHAAPAPDSPQTYQRCTRDKVPGETDYALYDVEATDKYYLHKHEGLNSRTSCEYIPRPDNQHTIPGIPENRTIESVKKGHWQSSLGFGGIGELPQSRRHSFADIPTRQNSIGSASDYQNGNTTRTIVGARLSDPHDSPGGFDVLARPSQGEGSEYIHSLYSPSVEEQILELQHLQDRNFAVSYFTRTDLPTRRSMESPSVSLSSTNMHQAYMQTQYNRPQHLAHTSRPMQLLYMVTFKAQRADVFYVQEGTGLHVRKGDLVIVEADRGADLGTVASESVPFTEAKEIREKFMQEHYQWLMVFSRHGQNGTVAGPNPNSQPNTANSAVGSIGGAPGHSGDMPTSELKPKMIKRLAQSHEIQTLRDKEGNEAKAKRVCQQKVVEHRLNMEILEAEFQMDWKKLTFYYFADEYINFNALVTDLFKVYKTRIWMSAINPASFQTPLGGLQIPGAMGSGQNAFGCDIDRYADRRQQRQHPTSTSIGPTQSALGTFDQAWNPSRDSNAVNSMAFQQLYGQPFQTSDPDVRHLDQYPMAYRQNASHQVLNMQSPFASGSYHSPNLHHSSSFTSRPDSSNGVPPPSQVLSRDWNQSFQGLSLGH